MKKSEAVIQLLQRLDVLDRVRELHKKNKHPKSLEQLFDEGTNIDNMFYFPEEELEYWDIISKMIQIVLDGVDGYNEEQSVQECSEENTKGIFDENKEYIIETLDFINKKLDDIIIKQQSKETKGIFDDIERGLKFLQERESDDIIRFVELDGNGYVVSVSGKDYGFSEAEVMLLFLQDYLEDRGIVLPQNKYFN